MMNLGFYQNGHAPRIALGLHIPIWRCEQAPRQWYFYEKHPDRMGSIADKCTQVLPLLFFMGDSSFRFGGEFHPPRASQRCLECPK